MKKKSMKKEIMIIGGGASGMVAGITAARQGALVTIIEQKNELGKKLLATGNGRCNFTNLTMNPECFYCQDSTFTGNLLEVYTSKRIMDFFQGIGVFCKDRNGYVYPITDQASTIRNALAEELKSLGVTILLDTAVVGIKEDENKWTLSVECLDEKKQMKSKKYEISGDAIILATGGKSGLSKQTKSHGYSLISSTKHQLTTLSPALVPLVGEGKFFKKISGIRTDVKIQAILDGKSIANESGELQLTDYGISGIPVFQLSRIFTQKLRENPSKKYKLGMEINFLPGFSIEELEELFINRQNQWGNRTMMTFLNGIMKEKLATFFLYTARIDEATLAKDVTLEELRKLMRIITSFYVGIEDSKDFPQSQVTAGGIPVSEVKSTLESIYHKNLYFTGEVLDIDGICGGYNLHFAWATGLLAGAECVSDK